MLEKRFEISECEGVAKAVYIIVDKQTGVNDFSPNSAMQEGCVLCWIAMESRW